MDITSLVERVKSYNPNSDISCIQRAYECGEKAHRGQYRDSGEAFFQHPVSVARILSELELDPVTIAAGLLHDVLEDTDVTREELEEEFGSEIVRLVDGVTKLSKIQFQSKEERQAHSL